MKKLLIAFCAVTILLSPVPCGYAQAPPDLVLVNGTIYTVNENKPTAKALAISNGKITAIGRTDKILAGAGAGTRVVDLQGKTVVPGFIDAHGHLMGLGFSLQRLNFSGAKNYREVIDAVAAKAGSVPKGDWILGRGWDQNEWPSRSLPMHAPLSRSSPDHPVALTRIDGHALLVNRKAMEIAGIDRDSADPPGGRILHDDQGEPTGVLLDRARGLVSRHIPPESVQARREAVSLAIRECLKYGLTSVHDAGVSGADIDLYKAMIDENAFDLHVYAMIRATNASTINRYFRSGPLIDYGGKLTVRSVKAMMDGALGSRGAALFEPYSDDPGNSGLLIMKMEELRDLTLRALAAGFQVSTHAIGDKANHEALDAYQAALRTPYLKKKARDARLRIEHAQVVALKDIPRFAELGVIPSMQATHATSDMGWVRDRLGGDRVAGSYAWRRFLNSGSRIANGSDFPVESPNPLWGFYAAVTRQNHDGTPAGGWRPGQLMTRLETLKSFTLDAAYAAFEEGAKGSIEVGKIADIVVLSADIMKIEAAQILSTRVTMTILGGKIVYEHP